jgi:hypothetical protein
MNDDGDSATVGMTGQATGAQDAGTAAQGTRVSRAGHARLAVQAASRARTLRTGRGRAGHHAPRRGRQAAASCAGQQAAPGRRTQASHRPSRWRATSYSTGHATGWPQSAASGKPRAEPRWLPWAEPATQVAVGEPGAGEPRTTQAIAGGLAAHRSPRAASGCHGRTRKGCEGVVPRRDSRQAAGTPSPRGSRRGRGKGGGKLTSMGALVDGKTTGQRALDNEGKSVREGR